MSMFENVVFGAQNTFDDDDSSTSASTITTTTRQQNYVHIRIQQRNGRKSLTTVQGLPSDLDLKRILKALKKTYNTNGTILNDDEMGQVLQVQGDQRKNVHEFLTMCNICRKDEIKIHGF